MYPRAFGIRLDMKMGFFAAIQVAGFYIHTGWIGNIFPERLGNTSFGPMGGLYFGIRNLAAVCGPVQNLQFDLSPSSVYNRVSAMIINPFNRYLMRHFNGTYALNAGSFGRRVLKSELKKNDVARGQNMVCRGTVIGKARQRRGVIIPPLRFRRPFFGPPSSPNDLFTKSDDLFTKSEADLTPTGERTEFKWRHGIEIPYRTRAKTEFDWREKEGRQPFVKERTEYRWLDGKAIEYHTREPTEYKWIEEDGQQSQESQARKPTWSRWFGRWGEQSHPRKLTKSMMGGAKKQQSSAEMSTDSKWSDEEDKPSRATKPSRSKTGGRKGRQGHFKEATEFKKRDREGRKKTKEEKKLERQQEKEWKKTNKKWQRMRDDEQKRLKKIEKYFAPGTCVIGQSDMGALRPMDL